MASAPSLTRDTTGLVTVPATSGGVHLVRPVVAAAPSRPSLPWPMARAALPAAGR